MSAQRQWVVVAIIVVASAAALAVAVRVMSGRLEAVEAGARAPDFHAVQIALNGSAPPLPRTMADYRGKVVLLNIWATWCNPCRAEMPSIQRLQEELGPQGLAIVAVSIDNPGMETSIREFAQELHLRFDILYDATGGIRADYQATGAPETFIIGKDGVIRKRVIGAADWSAEPQKALLRRLLADPTA